MTSTEFCSLLGDAIHDLEQVKAAADCQVLGLGRLHGGRGCLSRHVTYNEIDSHEADVSLRETARTIAGYLAAKVSNVL